MGTAQSPQLKIMSFGFWVLGFRFLITRYEGEICELLYTDVDSAHGLICTESDPTAHQYADIFPDVSHRERHLCKLRGFWVKG